MTWLETVPTIAVAALVVIMPGAILGRALGARGLAWLAAAAPLTVSLVAVGTIAAGAIGLRWNPVVLGIFTLASAGIVWGVRKLVATRMAMVNRATQRPATKPAGRPSELHRAELRPAAQQRTTPAMVLAGIGGLAFGVAAIWSNLTRTFIAPENISQTYDNVHHLSAIRAIVESGNGSAFSVGAMIHNGPSGVYPFAWHNLVALTVELSNVPLPVAVNSVNIVIGALVWTLACMYLATCVAGNRPAVLLLSGALAGSFGAFPFLALGWGVLYPNFLAIALLPVFIGLVADLLKLSVKPRNGPVVSLAFLVIGAPGLALAHPNVVMALAAFTIPLLLFWLGRLIGARKFPLGAMGAATLGVALYLVVFVAAWDRIRPSAAGSHWPPTLTLPVAAGEALATSPLQVLFSWPVFLLTLLGIAAVCAQWRRLWVLGPFLVGVMFFVVVSGFPDNELRHSITGVFFNDSNRLAALLPVMALPVMVMGAFWCFDLAVKAIPANVLAAAPRAAAVAGVGVVAALVLGLSTQNNSVATTVVETSDYYASTPDSWLLSSDEAALIKRAPEHIPADATVIGHPANGGSLIYALDGYKTIMPSLASVQSPEIQTIWSHLPELNENPAVCEAIRTLDAYYYLDFGSGRQVSDMRMTIPSSEDLALTPGLTLLDEQGAARLYRIDACQ
ncbi:hypothetical protein ART_1666 [Arthrobacter sp. PAMC 25486]|uniref:DUF6541 family protein n=1 Tax=Arthrobacter sp. PAMC 25486 TaxID=1494608 RepID=UPI000535C91C|nr:DUF6541 family protein [Arthrobacter sp. PAMC 25486]AIY01265.1 hypothetical protein ART_1666 [Arthrobacter sp. PAMC 25486]